ncbi:MAG: DUF393 domain-containing protein [Bacteroidetes bacterium]|nr:DUF393 domain-containing protein [Bacteroidota bacterium]
MKTLGNYKLIFDAECPLCRTYSSTFVKAGMLEKGGIEAYQKINQTTKDLIDTDRARNEIALVNETTGEVHYGLDSIFTVLGNSWPWLKKFFDATGVRFVLRRLYYFISFNRKIIVPSGNATDTCVPDVRLDYRWAYIIFCWLITSLILKNYSFHFFPLIRPSLFYREFLICGGQILFQGALISFIDKTKRIDYLGNMMTVSFAGGLLLIVGIYLLRILEHFSSIFFSPWFYVLWFLGVALWMLYEHGRRAELLGLGWLISIGWISYRIGVLLLIK